MYFRCFSLRSPWYDVYIVVLLNTVVLFSARTIQHSITPELLEYVLLSLTRVTKSYLLALGTTQISSFSPSTELKVSNSSDRELPRDMFRLKPSRITLVELSCYVVSTDCSTRSAVDSCDSNNSSSNNWCRRRPFPLFRKMRDYCCNPDIERIMA